jgi:hypothetical protein
MSTDLPKALAESAPLDRLMREMLEELRRLGGVPTHMCTSADGERVVYFGRVGIALDPGDWGMFSSDKAEHVVAGASVHLKTSNST